MPDFFEPAAAWDKARHPPKNDEDKQAFQAFFAGPANPAASVEKLERVARALRAEGVEQVGAYGLCWGVYDARVAMEWMLILFALGGKVVILTGSKADSGLDAIATIHPA